MDHDQRFKTLIREFFAEFMQLFFASWAARFNLDTVQWLPTEIFPNPPEGSRHQLDLVAQLRTREQVADRHSTDQEQWLALVHIEIESPDRTKGIKSRLPAYHIHLRDQYGLPVLPIVLYLKVGLDGIGVDTHEERFWELRVLAFDYLYVGLPGLDAVQYFRGESWLGVALAALMRIPPDQVAQLGVEALQRLTEAPLSEQRRFLLTDCVEAYLPLDEQQRLEYDRILSESPNEKVRAMNKTTFEKGLEKGLSQGLEQGLQETLLRQGRKRFRSLPSDVEQRIRSIQDVNRLETLTDRILEADSWEELLA